MAVLTPDDAKRRDLTQGSLTRTLLRMSFPIMGFMLLNNLYAVVDAFWLGKLKGGVSDPLRATEALAAVGPAAALQFIVVAFGTGFGSGGTALMAQFVGAKRHRDADRAAGQTLLLLLLATIVLGALMYIFAPEVLRLMQTPPNVMPKALPFLRILLLAMPFIAFNVAYGSALRALGDTITVVYVGIGSNVLNFFLSPAFIFGIGPAPAMGVRGAALVSAFSSALNAVICLILLLRGRSGLRLRWADIRPDWPIMRQVFNIGLPAAVSYGSNSLGFLVLQGMINAIGATVMAAYTVGSRITTFFGIPATALSMSCAPIVGQALGAGKPALAHRAVRKSVMLFAFGMFLPLVFLVFEGHLVGRAFTAEPRVIAEIRRFFFLVPASNYFFNVMMVVMAAFIGSGHTRPVMVISLVRQWALRVPIALLLGFVVGWQSLGIYAGLAIGNVIAAVMTWQVFRKGTWARAVVSARAEVIEPRRGPAVAGGPAPAPVRTAPLASAGETGRP